MHLRGGLWMTFRAARIEHSSSVEAASIAVSIEPTPAAERAALYARVVGLSERGAELVQHLVGGHDTRAIANRMYVSEHTVQDHLKSVFAKAGVNNRRLLTAWNRRGVNLRQFIDRSSGAFASQETRPVLAAQDQSPQVLRLLVEDVVTLSVEHHPRGSVAISLSS